MSETIEKLVKTIKSRKGNDVKSSYTSFLLSKGNDHCLNKLKEEVAELEDSIKTWKKLLKIEENHLEALLGVGRSSHVLGNYKIAKKYLEKVLEQDSNERRAIRTLALVYDRTKEFEKALKLYNIECKNYR